MHTSRQTQTATKSRSPTQRTTSASATRPPPTSPSSTTVAAITVWTCPRASSSARTLRSRWCSTGAGPRTRSGSFRTSSLRVIAAAGPTVRVRVRVCARERRAGRFGGLWSSMRGRRCVWRSGCGRLRRLRCLTRIGMALELDDDSGVAGHGCSVAHTYARAVPVSSDQLYTCAT